jgi:hypothetical protein
MRFLHHTRPTHVTLGANSTVRAPHLLIKVLAIGGDEKRAVDRVCRAFTTPPRRASVDRVPMRMERSTSGRLVTGSGRCWPFISSPGRRFACGSPRLADLCRSDEAPLKGLAPWLN